jgi:hypothetical protein
MQVEALKSVEATRLAGNTSRLVASRWADKGESPEVNVEVASGTAQKATSAPAEPILSTFRCGEC